MKKVISIVLVMVMTLSMVACSDAPSKEQQGSSASKEELVVKEGIPSYEDDIQIELAAYSGPRRAGYRNYNNIYGGHPDDPEGGWDGWITEEGFQDYMDCGFTYLLGDFDTNYDLNVPFEGSGTQEYMEMADKMGIGVVLTVSQLGSLTSNPDYRLNKDLKVMLDQMIENLLPYESFKGFSFRDEPNYEWAKTFGLVQEYLLEQKDDLFFFTSLLPIYAEPSRLTNKYDGSVEHAYEDYVNAYLDSTDTFVYDSYPFYLNPMTNETRLDETWLQNLRIVAEKRKEKGGTAGITIQSCAFGPAGMENQVEHKRATNTKADIAFQVYSSLAYGMDLITYFTYWEHINASDAEVFYSAMVLYPEENGQEPIKTDAYYAVKEVNHEIKKFDHVFLRYDWEGTMTVAKEGAQRSPMLALEGGKYSSPRISKVTATDEAIIGCLKDEEGYDGFMIVNMTDPGKNLSNSVTVTFEKASKAIVYVEGEEQTVDLKDGTYTFDLSSGEGVFVIPIV